MVVNIPQASLSDEILDFLLSQPTPQQILELRASETAQERLRDLLDKNRQNALNDAERLELDVFIQLDNLVARLKARAKG
jgi:hypothetical protein